MKEAKIAKFVYGELIKRDEVYPEKAYEKNTSKMLTTSTSKKTPLFS